MRKEGQERNFFGLFQKNCADFGGPNLSQNFFGPNFFEKKNFFFENYFCVFLENDFAAFCQFFLLA